MTSKPVSTQGVNAAGDPVPDPTRNVLDLVDAAVTRLNDISALTARMQAAEISHLKVIDQLRADHAREIRLLDNDRWTQTRKVDVDAVGETSKSAAAAIAVLATTQAANAESIRTTMQQTAQTLAKQYSDSASALAAQTASTFDAMLKRVTALEQTSYVGQGQKAISDPASAELASAVKALLAAQSQGVGKWIGIGFAVGLVPVVIAVAAYFAK